MKPYYHVEPVSEHIQAIKSMGGEYMYLIVGEEKALLIDTCVGVGHLKDFVSQLTNLPLIVALTHGHIDHAMGAPEFEIVYLNPLDIPIYQSMCSKEERKGYLTATIGADIAHQLEGSLLEAVPNYSFLPLEDQQIFDLGNMHVSAHTFPGHTPGMIVFLVEEEGILILGDACNNSTFLFDENASDIEHYRAAVEATQQSLQGKFHRVLVSHHEMDVQTNIMVNMLDVCDDIMGNRADNIPFSFMGMQACIAKNCDAQFHRTDGKDGNLIYNKEKIFARKENSR